MSISFPPFSLRGAGAIATSIIVAGLSLGAVVSIPEAASARQPNREIVRCQSRRDRTESCYIRTSGRVRLLRQLSRSSCNGNWGYARNRIWVRNGCRADFLVRYSGTRAKYRYERGNRNPYDYDNGDYRYERRDRNDGYYN